MKKKILISAFLLVAFVAALTIDYSHSTNQNGLTTKNIEMIEAKAGPRGYRGWNGCGECSVCSCTLDGIVDIMVFK